MHDVTCIPEIQINISQSICLQVTATKLYRTRIQIKILIAEDLGLRIQQNTAAETSV